MGIGLWISALFPFLKLEFWEWVVCCFNLCCYCWGSSLLWGLVISISASPAPSNLFLSSLADKGMDRTCLFWRRESNSSWKERLYSNFPQPEGAVSNLGTILAAPSPLYSDSSTWDICSRSERRSSSPRLIILVSGPISCVSMYEFYASRFFLDSYFTLFGVSSNFSDPLCWSYFLRFVLSDYYNSPPALSLADCKLFTYSTFCGSSSSHSLSFQTFYYLLLYARDFFSFLAIYVFKYSLWKFIFSKAVAILLSFLPALAPVYFSCEDRLWPALCIGLFFLVVVDNWSLTALFVVWS